MNTEIDDFSSKPEYTKLADEELVELSKRDEMAMEVLISRYKNLARFKARIYFLVGADRDDIIQEGMIGLFKAVRDFDANKFASFRSFAELCVKRQIITAIKTATRQKHIPLNSYVSLSKPVYDDESERTLADTLLENVSTNPEHLILAKEMALDIEKQINADLSDFENKVFAMYLDGNSYQEIAELMNKSPKSIDNALQRIKRKIDKIITKLRCPSE